jgi:hypothetical protein
VEQKALVVKQETLALRSMPDQPIAPPKITLPPAAASAIPALTADKTALPEKPAEKPVVKPVVPRAPDVADVQSARNQQQGLLVMNAIAPAPDLTAKIPRAEARGLFAVAPAEVTVIADPAAGAKGGDASAAAAGTGTRADVAKGDAIAEIAAGGNAASTASVGSGSGKGSRYGSGLGSGLNSAGNSNGAGRGAGSESGVGAGSATSTASGNGPGSASGKGGFPGIAIQGGRYGNGDAGDLHPSSAPHRQTSYNMNIVSTASSGGGLPDFGAFNNEKVYTVYVDMKANDEDPAPNWILQYALLQPAPGATGVPGISAKIQGTPTPPYAVLKDIPQFSPDLVRKYARNLIIAFAVMNSDGKLEQITLRQNSDGQLTSRLVEALSHWVFQPAEIDGQPVSLKVVLGVRLSPAL